MLPILECQDIRKQYGSHHSLGRPREGVALEVQRGELFAIIGPSGCGKTTLLRIVGGFIAPSSGNILIDGSVVTDLPPHSRPTNMVFQNYALFPHMTVFENVSFGLEMEHVRSKERHSRVSTALQSVGLERLGSRYISELSGGQMQRAALARALVKRPSVVLLDEPLGALDLKLRKQMQDEIVRLKNELGMTIMHVTHDQEEACAIADRIAVLRAGLVLQVDRPVDLYRRPRTAFVAEFIGAGTVVRGTVERSGSSVRLSNSSLVVTGDLDAAMMSGSIACLLPRRGALIRKSEIECELPPNSVGGLLTRMAFSGVDYVAQVKIADDTTISVQLDIDQVESMQIELGSKVVLTWRREQIRFVTDDESPH